MLDRFGDSSSLLMFGVSFNLLIVLLCILSGISSLLLYNLQQGLFIILLGLTTIKNAYVS